MGVEKRTQMGGVENICTYVRGNASMMEKIAYQGTSDLYSSPRRIEWAGHVALVEEMKNTCKVLVIKSEG